MTGNNDYIGKKCRYASVCGCVCDDNVPVTECPNYWSLDDLYSDLPSRVTTTSLMTNDEFEDDGDFEEEDEE